MTPYHPLTTAPLGCPVQLRVIRSGVSFLGTVRELESGVCVAESAELAGMFHADVVEWAAIDEPTIDRARCSECGTCCIDEDGCCATCGRDAELTYSDGVVVGRTELSGKADGGAL